MRVMNSRILTSALLSIIFVSILLQPVSASPSLLWKYSDTCAVFSISMNSRGYIGLAFGYYGEVLSPEGKLLWKAPTRGIAYAASLSDNGILLIGTEGRWLQAFKNGRVLWEIPLGNEIVSDSISRNGTYTLAGDASGNVYFIKQGKIVWKKSLGSYTWDVLLGKGTIIAGTDTGIHVLSYGGKPLWSSSPGPVRNVLIVGNEIIALVVQNKETWSKVIAYSENGKVLWQKRFNGYVRGISSDGKRIAIAGDFGRVVLLDSNGSTVYSLLLVGYAYDVATRGGYTVLSYGRDAELIGPEGKVIWFKTFNGTAYHVAFSPMDYFITEYGSHNVQNCYSVLEAWPLNETTTTASSSSNTNNQSKPLRASPVLPVLITAIVLVGVLIWRKR